MAFKSNKLNKNNSQQKNQKSEDILFNKNKLHLIEKLKNKHSLKKIKELQQKQQKKLRSDSIVEIKNLPEENNVIGKIELTLSKKIKKTLKNIYSEFSSPIKQILFWYIIITIFGALMLFLPFTQQSTYAANISFIDALFIAASAFSDTGLSTIDISIAFNVIGQSLIAFLILFGGIGWFGIKLFILHFVIKKVVTHKSLHVLNNERGYSRLGSTFDVIKVAIVVQAIAILICGIALSLSFYTSTPTNGDQFIEFLLKNSYIDPDTPSNVITNTSIGNDLANKFLIVNKGIIEIHPNIKTQEIIDAMSPQGNLNSSFRNGFFISISAINNAGFDTLMSSSISPYVLNYDIQLFLIFLFILGGIGFPAIYDIKEYFVNKRHNETFRFSLLTKLSTTSYLIVSLSIWVLTLTSELGISAESSPLVDPSKFAGGGFGQSNSMVYSKGEQVWILTFLSFSTRNAGFSTINLQLISPGTLFIFMLSMFIGSSPASTTGGIRNTTIAVIVLSLFSFSRGRERTSVYKKTIPQNQINNALSILTFSIILVMLVSLITATSLDAPVGNNLRFEDMLFEVFSAFGTTGLSTGMTTKLNEVSKIAIIFMMFIGQLGISTTIKQLTPKNIKFQNTHYPEEEIALG